MKHISPDPLSRAIERLVSEIGIFADDEEADIKPEQLERFARAISVQLKALHDIEDNNLQAAKHDEDKKYLSYEDLPPPNPEERARFRLRLDSLIRQIEAGDEIPDFDEASGKKH